MPASKDLTGQTFGRLTVEAFAGRRRIGQKSVRYWRCRCECGTVIERAGGMITSGKTRSCGCLLLDTITTHGATRDKDPVYSVWHAMVTRCRSASDPAFGDYGGRGISVCARWADFAVFRADMGPRPKGATLERADVNAHYEPTNCRWATPLEQANNRRNNRRITFNGETLTVAQWAARLRVSKNCLLYRLNAGWPLDHALTYPSDRHVQHR